MSDETFYPLDCTGFLPPIIIGCDWSGTLGLQNDDGTAVDITSYTMALTLFDQNGNTLATAATNGTITNGGATGVFAVAFPRAFTGTLTAQVVRVFASYTVGGLEKAWLAGTLEIRAENQ